MKQEEKNTFVAAYEKDGFALAYRRFSADTHTPVSAFLKISELYHDSVFYESVSNPPPFSDSPGGAGRGRYSVIQFDPDLIFTIKDGAAFTERPDISGVIVKTERVDEPLAALKKIIRELKGSVPQHLPGISAGLYGYFAYDAIRLIEKLPPAPRDDIQIPDVRLIRPRCGILFDLAYDVFYLLAPVYKTTGVDGAAAYDLACERLAKIENILHTGQTPGVLECPDEAKTRPLTELFEELGVRFHTKKSDHLQSIEKCIEYIYAGDAFQIVPSQRFSTSFPTSAAFDLYRALRRVNPSPYMFYVCNPSFALVGSSPEILINLKGKTVTVRPIAGTRPRGADQEEDIRLEAELLNDPKELSEHLMLLDLGRNDVARVTKAGTVRVTEEFIVERYSHVMHIVSNVCGEIADDCDSVDALFSGLPAGTVSGAPKIRAMQIINELEPEKRGFYAGAAGYFSVNGETETAIMLRTGLLKDNKLYIQAGGGVVAKSDPESEYIETVNKSGALLKAAAIVKKNLAKS